MTPEYINQRLKRAYVAGAMNVARVSGITGEKLKKVASHISSEYDKRGENAKALLEAVRAKLKTT